MGEKVIKVFATDLDGTFLNDQKSFDNDFFEKILEKIQSINGRFVITTGREPQVIKKLFSDFIDNPILDYIANNGAYVTADHQVIQYDYLDSELIEEIWNFFLAYHDQPDQLMTFSTADQIYVPREYLKLDQSQLMKAPVEITPIDDIHQISDKVMKIACLWQNEVEPEQLTKELQSRFKAKLHATQSGFGTIDIISGNINKAQGLSRYAETLKIKPDQIAAFGDGGNDIEMLSYVGRPFAMPNSPERILALDYPLADDTNQNSGVLKTIERLIETEI